MDIIYLATFLVAFSSSFLSGIAGGGGGFVTPAYWLIAGISPAQGAATGAFMATGMTLSSSLVLRKSGHIPDDKKLLITLVVVAFIASIVGAILVPKLDVGAYKTTLALVTIGAVPLLFVQPRFTHRLQDYSVAGIIIVSLCLVAGSIIISSAFSILFALSLMAFFNLTVLQMTALKRVVGIIQSFVLFTALTIQGYFVLSHAIAAFIGGGLGSYLGTKYAIKKGDTFARYALAAMSIVGAFLLIL